MNEIEWLDMFADNLYSIMQAYGMRQNEFAEYCGLAKSAMSDYLNRRKIPTIKSILAISYATDIEVNELIDFGNKIV